MPLKRCPKCGETKPFEAFSKCKSRRDGFQSNCKDCKRRYREANRDAIRERNRRYYEENIEAIIEYRRCYREENRSAVLEQARRYQKENQDITAEVANRKNQPWTEAEDAYLMSSSDQITVQAVELGRTHSSVANRRMTLRKKAKASA